MGREWNQLRMEPWVIFKEQIMILTMREREHFGENPSRWFSVTGKSPKSWVPPLCMADPPLISPGSTWLLPLLPQASCFHGGHSSRSGLKLGIRRCICWGLVGQTEIVLGISNRRDLIQGITHVLESWKSKRGHWGNPDISTLVTVVNSYSP